MTQSEFANKLLNQQREFFSKLNRHMPLLSSDQMKFFIGKEGTDGLRKVLRQLALEYWRPLWKQYYKERWCLEIDWDEARIDLQPDEMTELLVMHPEITLKKMLEKISNPPTTCVNWNLHSNDFRAEQIKKHLMEHYDQPRHFPYGVWHQQEPFIVDTFYGSARKINDVVKKVRQTMDLLELLILNDFMVQMELTERTSIFGQEGIMTLQDTYFGDFILVQCPRPEYRNPDLLINMCDLSMHLAERNKCTIPMKKSMRLAIGY